MFVPTRMLSRLSPMILAMVAPCRPDRAGHPLIRRCCNASHEAGQPKLAGLGERDGVGIGTLGEPAWSRYLTGMPATKTPRLTSSDDVNAAIERVTPDVLALLANGVPRNRAAIVAALDGRHPKQDVKRALARLSVLGRLDLQGSRYTLAAAEAEQG
jgi:hypothetical protein